MAHLNLDVALDLGSDSVKVVYAYKDERGLSRLGQLSLGASLSQIGFPSMAFYDAENDKWLYCNEVEESGKEDFTTVVRIKSLMELEKKNADETIEKNNRRYYQSGNYFPKFYLPSERTQMDDFDNLVKSGHAFQANGWTPKTVCEGFFAYIKSAIDKRLVELKKKLSRGDFNLRYSLVYPPNVGTEYIEEAERLLENAFKVKPYRSANTTKAISYAAYKKGIVRRNERFLVFDLGEEYISVAKAWINENGYPFVDGVEGHSQPARLGGIEIDEALRKQLLREIEEKETFGTPSFNQSGHVSEDCAKAKLYQLLSYIKSAKIYLGEADWADDEEIPLYICQDVYVRSSLTRNKLANCLGVKGAVKKDAIAEKLIQYIVDEIQAPINKDVSRIVLAGGVMETQGLSEYIMKRVGELLRTMRGRVSVFQTVGSKLDEFSLDDNQAVYAAAIGCAMAASDGLDFTTVLSLSYGVWGRSEGIRWFAFVAGKGDVLHHKGETQFLQEFSLNGITEKIEEKVYSMNFSEADVNNKKGETPSTRMYMRGSRGETCLMIGEPGSKMRQRVEDPNGVGLKTLVGCDQNGNDIDAQLYYQGERVRIEFVFKSDASFSIREGIVAQRDGRARVVVENNREKNRGRFVYISKYNPHPQNARDPWLAFDRRTMVELTEIEIRFPKTEIDLEEN